MLLNGTWVDRDEKVDVINPQNGTIVGKVPRGSESDMLAAIAFAEQASATARAMPTSERMRILHGAADYIEQHSEQVARTIALEGIKVIHEARRETARCVDTLRLSAEEARRIGGEVIRFDQVESGHSKTGYYVREPVGLVAAITPANDPLNLVAHKVGPAIASGNVIIVKPHEETPLSALHIGRAFVQSGLPGGILQIVTGSGEEIGPVLTSDPRVGMISFTGSYATGMSIARNAGVKKLSMELGGNGAVIVEPDADLEAAVASIVSGAFAAAGQNCVHVQRVFIHESIAKYFTEQMISMTQSIRLGDKLDEKTCMGPMLNLREAQRIEALVKDAVEKGAKILVGGKRSNCFFDATLMSNVPDNCQLLKNEIFGPVTLLQSYMEIDSAIKEVNAVDTGLHAAVFTTNLHTAHNAAMQLNCGAVMINESTDFRIDAMPFGGCKNSGIGREGVRFAINDMTVQKVICINLGTASHSA